MAKSNGRLPWFWFLLVLCLVVGNLPSLMARCHRSKPSDSFTEKFSGRIEKGHVNPPRGPSPGTHPEEPPLPVPPSPRLIPSPDSPTPMEQIHKNELRPKRMLKGPVNPPSGPSPGTHLDEPPLPVLPSPPQILSIPKKQIQNKLHPKRILKGPVNPPSGPSPGTHPDEPPLPPIIPSPDLSSTQKQIQKNELHPKRILKGPVKPPSGPNPSTSFDEPPLPPPLIPSPDLLIPRGF